MSNLANEYKASVAPALMKKFGYKSVMQIPKLDKVVINVGAGEAKDNSKVIDAIINEAVDRILLMKILPRVEGDNEMFALSHAEQQKYGVKYANRLEWLLDLAPEISVTEDADADHQQTAKEKIQEMIDRLESREFTRYWP